MMRLELLDHGRRERVVLERSRYTVDSVSEEKAGGPGLQIGAAMFMWFIKGGRREEISLFDGSTVYDMDDQGVLGTVSTRDPASFSGYADVTDRTIEELLEAERLASPEDFPPMEYDMGRPVGFLARLWAVWLENREAGA